jgi:hypothetical protein
MFESAASAPSSGKGYRKGRARAFDRVKRLVFSMIARFEVASGGSV